MRKTIWIARDGEFYDGAYAVGKAKLTRGEGYGERVYFKGGDFEFCADIFELFLPPADRLKPGEGPKRIKITLGGG